MREFAYRMIQLNLAVKLKDPFVTSKEIHERTGKTGKSSSYILSVS